MWLCSWLTNGPGHQAYFCCAGLGQKKARWVGLDVLQERLEYFSGFVFGHDIAAKQWAEFNSTLPGQ